MTRQKDQVLITWINKGAAWALRSAAIFLVAKRWRNLRGALDKAITIGPKEDLGCLPRALICAEDNRFLSHGGIDVVGIVRAIWCLATLRKIQGASTITQQLVRTVTHDYKVNVWRKLREILLAVLTDARYTKDVQILLYLKFAYFGWQMNGVDQAMRRLGYAYPPSCDEAAQIVARLKYPEPKRASSERKRLISRRARMIQTKVLGATHELR